MWRALVLSFLVSSAVSASSVTTADPQEIVIDDYAFTPVAVTVAKGGVVRWINRDRVPHAVVLPGGVRSSVLAPGDSFEWSFPQPGTVVYGCPLHPTMAAELEVEESR